jgi:hypothetical protein
VAAKLKADRSPERPRSEAPELRGGRSRHRKGENDEHPPKPARKLNHTQRDTSGQRAVQPAVGRPITPTAQETRFHR